MLSNRWLIGALVLSLVANLALAGYLLGRTTSNVNPIRVTADPAAGFVRLLGFLPEERRNALIPIVTHHVDQIRPEIEETRKHLRAMLDVLTQEPFQADLLSAEMAELRRLHAITQHEMHQSFVEMVEQLTPTERREFAEALQRVPASAYPPAHGDEHSPGRREPGMAEHPPPGPQQAPGDRP